LINPQLTSLYCNFSYGFKKGPTKYFWDTKSDGAILYISPPLLKVGAGSAPPQAYPATPSLTSLVILLLQPITACT